ncbi:MAG: T9SS type A sorting domain-containing protein, partial [Ignavibacteriaceae bacterium]|nr:T9SS type A sorting domain-containing protein [Ignavibacteriaceae bacterium]
FYNKIIDTGDPDCSLIGGGWTASTISGFYGTTQSMYVTKGSGDKYAEFKLNLPQSTNYEISAWWTAASNRAKDVPFIIHHLNEIDTVRVDQSINGSKWNRIGEWTFAGDALDKVIISNAATQGDVIVADAIRILSFDSLMVSTKEIKIKKDLNFELLQNYPNPFNPVTKIDFTIPPVGQDGILSYNTLLRIYNILGDEVVTLVDEVKPPGNYSVEFDGTNYSSGVYFVKLSNGFMQSVRKIVLMK